MKLLMKWALILAVPLLLVLSLSAGAGSAPTGKAKPIRPSTLVTMKAPIRAFAQDQETIAWIGSGYWVHVRSLRAQASAAVGYAGPARTGARWNPALTLAGSRALWNTFPSGGNSLESQLETAAPWDPYATAIDLFIDNQSPNGGSFLGGLAGDGPTLVYGTTYEKCDDPGGNNCNRLDAVGGVVVVTGQYEASTVPGIPPPVMVAFSAHDPQSSVQISQGLIAVAPAETPVTTDLGSAPRVRQNGPVEVFRGLFNGVAHLSSRVAPVGTVRAIALDFHQLAVLIERADGAKAIERYNPEQGTLIGTTSVPRSTAAKLSVSKAGIVYRVGSKIYLIAGNGLSRVVWKASATPIGLSIEGKRVAWAENVKGRGRVVTLTVP